MGIDSLMAFVTAQRTQEIGLRMALGASRWQFLRVAISRAMVITAAGSVIGAALSVGAGRIMESLLFGLVSNDFPQLAGLIAELTTVALIAAYLPARRAARVDPMTALRQS